MSFKRLSIIALVIFAIQAYAVALPRINNSIMPVKHFTGRVLEINEIEKRLFKKNQHIVTLVGIGGSGKTQIIRKFISQNRYKYTIIWEINCAVNINRQIKELGLAINENFGDKIKLTGTDAEVTQNVWAFLNSRQLKYLVAFDNLQIFQNKALDLVLPQKISGHVLIGTRDQENLPNILQISMLDKNASLKLINRLSLNKNLDAVKVYKDTSGHPLSIYKYISFGNENKYMNTDDISKLFFKEHVAYDLRGYVKSIIPNLDKRSLGALIKITLLDNRDVSKENFILLCSLEHDIKYLPTLIRFALLEEKVNYRREVIGFEMHDILKSQLQASVSLKVTKESIHEVIVAINKLFKDWRNLKQAA